MVQKVLQLRFWIAGKEYSPAGRTLARRRGSVGSRCRTWWRTRLPVPSGRLPSGGPARGCCGSRERARSPCKTTGTRQDIWANNKIALEDKWDASGYVGE